MIILCLLCAKCYSNCFVNVLLEANVIITSYKYKDWSTERLSNCLKLGKDESGFDPVSFDSKICMFQSTLYS